MKNVKAIVGLLFLLALLLCGAFLLPKTVQNVQGEGGMGALDGKLSAEPEVPVSGPSVDYGVAVRELASEQVVGPEVGAEDANDGEAASIAQGESSEPVANGAEGKAPDPLAKAGKPEVSLDAFFANLRGQNFAGARQFLDENRTALEPSLLANLEAMVGSNELQKQQLDATLAKTEVMMENQKKIEATLGEISKAPTSAGGESGDRNEKRTLPEALKIGFSFDSSEIASGQRAQVAEAAELLHNWPKLGVDLVGMSDGTGDPDYNRELSLRRAAVVSAFLTNAGISSERIALAAGNVEDEGQSKAEMRRVEIRFR